MRDVIPFPRRHRGDPPARQYALAALGFQWRGDVWTRGRVVLQLCKATVVISREQFIDGLRRGKTWRRQQALATRLEAPEPEQS